MYKFNFLKKERQENIQKEYVIHITDRFNPNIMGCGKSKVKADDPLDQIDQDEIDQAILDLKVTRDQLHIYQKQQERCQEVELAKAKELARKGQKERAKIVLRQKKAREYYIMNAEKNIENIENLINNITTKQLEMSFIRNLKQTNALMKKMNDLMPIEEVERIMDENQEQQERLDEINSLLSQDMNGNPEMRQFVDDDLDRMYEELETGEQDQDQEDESEKAKKTPQMLAC